MALYRRAGGLLREAAPGGLAVDGGRSGARRRRSQSARLRTITYNTGVEIRPRQRFA
jgi:hypothetical protein